ncbi:hypothetical protein MKX01_028060 [Papaver californicum]|nr:hypothetical protein MKX01_028060 [Papaver californicum]
MESPESYITSTTANTTTTDEVTQKQTSVPVKSSSISDDKERPTYIKFLVSNAAAGSVIGKGGSTITDFQSQSGAQIQLSRNNEFFPGTSDRIIMISGDFGEVTNAIALILFKLMSEVHSEDGDDAQPITKVRLIVPNSCCGGIIGKGGSTIKSFIEESQAGIKISPQDHTCVGLNDRLVTVTGTLEEQMRAIDLVFSKLVEDAHYAHCMNTPFSYSGMNFSGYHGFSYGYMVPPAGAVPYNSVNYRSNGSRAKHHNNKEDPSDSVTIGVADEHVGVVLGRGGRNIMEINQVSGARIKISDRGDFMPGTHDRKVTITGTKSAIRAAENMIKQRVASVTGSGSLGKAEK